MAFGSMFGTTLYFTKQFRPFKFNFLYCKRTYALNFSVNSGNNNNNERYLYSSEVEPPQEAVLKAISEVSKRDGRIGQTTNMVIGGTVTEDATNEWLVLDQKVSDSHIDFRLPLSSQVTMFVDAQEQKVNSYPTVRGFTAIGTGGDDVEHAMVVAVESVLQQPIPQGRVKQKVSSGGKYVSVNIGPVQVMSSEQVQAVYNAMRRDDRMKYFL